MTPEDQKRLEEIREVAGSCQRSHDEDEMEWLLDDGIPFLLSVIAGQQKALEGLLEFDTYMLDRGPPGEEWQSDELQAAIKQAKAFLPSPQ